MEFGVKQLGDPTFGDDESGCYQANGGAIGFLLPSGEKKYYVEDTEENRKALKDSGINPGNIYVDPKVTRKILQDTEAAVKGAKKN